MRITLYLLNNDVELDKAVLRNVDQYREISLIPPIEPLIEWKFYVRPSEPELASWIGNMQPVVRDPGALDMVRTQSSSGVLIVRIPGRVFAVTFGGGYHAIDPTSHVPGFGLRVTANIIAANKITSATPEGSVK